jgi:hypothetical protein
MQKTYLPTSIDSMRRPMEWCAPLRPNKLSGLLEFEFGRAASADQMVPAGHHFRLPTGDGVRIPFVIS